MSVNPTKTCSRLLHREATTATRRSQGEPLAQGLQFTQHVKGLRSYTAKLCLHTRDEIEGLGILRDHTAAAAHCTCAALDESVPLTAKSRVQVCEGVHSP